MKKRKLKKEIKEQQIFNMNMEHLEAYLQLAWEDGCDTDLLNKFMHHLKVITMIPIHNERLKDLAAKIYVYYQLLSPEIGISFETRNGTPVVKVKRIKIPF